VVELVHFTRRHRRVALGASPRAALALLLAERARALLQGRDFVLPDDIKALAPHVIAHRLLLIAEAEMEGVGAASVITEALAQVAVRPGERGRARELAKSDKGR
jgi:MoxR-like ATPase